MQIKIPNYNSETKFFTRYYFTVIFVCQFQKLDVTFGKKSCPEKKLVGMLVKINKLFFKGYLCIWYERFIKVDPCEKKNATRMDWLL